MNMFGSLLLFSVYSCCAPLFRVVIYTVCYTSVFVLCLFCVACVVSLLVLCCLSFIRVMSYLLYVLLLLLFVVGCYVLCVLFVCVLLLFGFGVVFLDFC
jgi:hypothetical protein